MDVRVIITLQADDSYQVDVAGGKSVGHLWRKKFKSKRICLTELKTLSLLTTAELTEVDTHHFNKSSRMLIFRSFTKLQILIKAGFAQTL